MKLVTPNLYKSQFVDNPIHLIIIFLWAGLSGVILALLPFFISIPLVLFPLFFVIPFYPGVLTFVGLWVCSGIFLNYTPIGTSARMSFLGPLLILLGSILAIVFGGEESKKSDNRDFSGNQLLKVLIVFVVAYCGLQSWISISLRNGDVSEVVLESAPVLVWVLLLFWRNSFSESGARGRLVFWGVLSISAAVVVVLQAKLNIPLMAGGRVESLRTLTSTYSDVTRTVTDNIHSIVLLLLLIPAFVTRFRPPVAITFIVALTCVLAIYFQYGRALWITVFIAILLFALLSLNFRQLMLSGFAFFVTVFAAITLFSLVESPVLKAGADRLLSVGAEVSSGSSFDWRRWENETAIKRISVNPIFGIGPGVHYRRVVDTGTFSAQTRYMHNSYLYVTMKYGAVGLLSLLGIIVIVFARVFKVMRSYRRGTWQRLLCGGIFSFFVMFLIISINQPELMAVMSSLTLVFASWIGLSIKMNEADSSCGSCTHA